MKNFENFDKLGIFAFILGSLISTGGILAMMYFDKKAQDEQKEVETADEDSTLELGEMTKDDPSESDENTSEEKSEMTFEATTVDPDSI